MPRRIPWSCARDTDPIEFTLHVLSRLVVPGQEARQRQPVPRSTVAWIWEPSGKSPGSTPQHTSALLRVASRRYSPNAETSPTGRVRARIAVYRVFFYGSNAGSAAQLDAVYCFYDGVKKLIWRDCPCIIKTLEPSESGLLPQSFCDCSLLG